MYIQWACGIPARRAQVNGRAPGRGRGRGRGRRLTFVPERGEAARVALAAVAPHEVLLPAVLRPRHVPVAQRAPPLLRVRSCTTTHHLGTIFGDGDPRSCVVATHSDDEKAKVGPDVLVCACPQCHCRFTHASPSHVLLASALHCVP